MTKVNCKQPWLVAGGVGGPVQPGPVPSGPVERAARGLARTRRLQSEGCAVHLGRGDGERHRLFLPSGGLLTPHDVERKFEVLLQDI